MTLGKTQVMNHVILAPGVPAKMHFSSWQYQPRDIRDSLSGQPKVVTALVMHVDELDGAPVSADYSTISDKEALNYKPFIADGTLSLYLFTVTKAGTRFSTERTVLVQRRAP
jgi:hypothetical protein